MCALTHRFGLELDLTSPESRHPAQKSRIEAIIRRKAGVIHAAFSKGHPDIIVVEYNPFIIKPDEISNRLKRLSGAVKRKVFL